MLRPFPSSMRAAATTPAEPLGACVARFPTGGSLPRFRGGSASALRVSGPARRSLTLRPAWSLSRPWRPVASACFRRCRYLHHPLRLLPAGATVAGRDSHPLRNGAFSRRTRKTTLRAINVSLATCTCSGLRTSVVVLENIANPGSDYLRMKQPLGSHYLRMSTDYLRLAHRIENEARGCENRRASQGQLFENETASRLTLSENEHRLSETGSQD